MKRIISTLLAGLMAVVSIQAQLVVVTKDKVNVRNENGSQVIGKAEYGTTFPLKQTVGQWNRIDYNGRPAAIATSVSTVIAQDAPTVQALKGDYVCRLSDSGGSLGFYTIGNALIAETTWGDEECFIGGDAYWCKLQGGKIVAYRHIELEMGYDLGPDTPPAKAAEMFEDMEKPLTIEYSAANRSFLLDGHVYKFSSNEGWQGQDPNGFSRFLASEKAPAAPKPVTDPNGVYDVPEVSAQFPSGDQGLQWFLANNLKYPKKCQENGIQGKVLVQFVVQKDGSITEIKVLRSVDPRLDAEAVRVVKKMPKWKPGMVDGKPVRSRFTLPFTFRLK